MKNFIVASAACAIFGVLGFYSERVFDAFSTDNQVTQGKTTSAQKFSDLPASEQERYVSKERLYEYGGYITPKSYTQIYSATEDNGTSIIELLSQNKALVADNIDLGEKNLELIDTIEDLKSALEEQKAELTAINSKALSLQEEKLNENIARLNKELSEAQKEGLSSISSYEKRIAMLENEMIKFRLEIDKNQTINNENMFNFIRESESNQTALGMQKMQLERDINTSNEKLAALNKELLGLKDELTRANELLNSAKNEAKKEIARISDGFDIQKRTLEDELSRKSDKIIDLDSELNALNLELNITKKGLEKASENLAKEKNSTRELKASLSKLNIENADLNETKSKLEKTLVLFEKEQNSTKALSQTLTELKSENSELNATLVIKSDSINELSKTITELRNLLNLKDQTMHLLESNVTQAKNELKITQDELANIKKSASVDARNYEILNIKINALKKELGEHKSDNATKTNASIKELEDRLRKNQELLAENNKTITELNEQISRIGKNSMSAAEYYKKIEELSKDIEINLNNQDRLEDENTNLRMILQTQTKPEVPKKLVFVSKIECHDMDSANAVSTMCKNRISEFLQHYNANYLYEVIPIVDEKGLGIPYDLAKGLKKEELDRLKQYVNQGIGKERAQAGAQLIRDEFGDFARISFSPDIVVKSSSRGFIVKAYR